MPPFLGRSCTRKAVDLLRGAFPRLTLRVTAGWSPALLQSVERGSLDASIVMMPSGFAPPETLRAARLAFLPTVIVAARALGLPDTPVTLADLARYEWVLNQDGCGMRSVLRRAMEAAGVPIQCRRRSVWLRAAIVPGSAWTRYRARHRRTCWNARCIVRRFRLSTPLTFARESMCGSFTVPSPAGSCGPLICCAVRSPRRSPKEQRRCNGKIQTPQTVWHPE